LNYPILPYPKGDNSEDYELGYVLKPKIIECNDEVRGFKICY
jgi:hypothetical protein